MFGIAQILVSPPVRAALVVVALAGCGQKGPLYLPTGEAAAGRAPLTETIAPSTSVAPPVSPAASGPAPAPAGQAAPVRTP
jgi:predicted small lipoprotein YifL